MSLLKINQKQKRVEVNSFEISNEIVFEFFNKLPQEQRDEKLFQALYIGCLALVEDRLSAFLSKTSNELGTQLESLKIIFDLKKEIFYKSAVKGIVAEEEIAEALKEYTTRRKIKDSIHLTGDSSGKISKNKTGDILIEIKENDFSARLGIECKFDKSVKLGLVEDKVLSTNKYDTALSQILETCVNRESSLAIIVFDRSLVDSTIEKNVEHVRYLSGLGFICIIDSQKADYSNLFISYEMARELLIAQKSIQHEGPILEFLIKKMIRDITSILKIKGMVESNISNNKEILVELDKGLASLEFSKKFFGSFLKTGQLTKEELLSFYNEDDLRDRYKEIKKEVDLI